MVDLGALEALSEEDLNGWSGEVELRRREVYAKELVAVAIMCDDIHDEVLERIRESPQFKALTSRLLGDAAA